MRQENRIAQWMKMEHYRLHVVEEWPDSPHKKAVLAAIRSTLGRLQTDLPSGFELQRCIVCSSRRAGSAVLEFPSASQRAPSITRLAA